MAERKSLGDLISEVPSLIIGLVRAEIESLTSELKGKAGKLGVGGGLLAGAGVFALFMLGWLLVAAFEGLRLVVAPWLAALIVAGGLLLIAGLLVAAGLPKLKRGTDLGHLQAVDSIKDDVNVIRGLGHASDGSSPLEDLPRPTNGATR